MTCLHKQGVFCGMKRRYDLIVFDWEGTLSEDLFGNLISLIQINADKLNLPAFNKSTALKYMPYGFATVFGKIFPELSIYECERLLEMVQNDMVHSKQKVCLVQDALDTIKQIHKAGMRLAIASNRTQSSLSKIVSQLGINEYFDVIWTASDAPPKPCPQMLLDIIEKVGVLPNKTLMIGDSTTDIEMAKSIAVDAIGVDFYNVHEQELLSAGAMLVLQNFKQLQKYLNVGKGGLYD
jgi:phosphoglycolate phosphatase